MSNEHKETTEPVANEYTPPQGESDSLGIDANVTGTEEFSPAWIAEGLFVSAIPVEEFGAELEMGVINGEEKGLAVMLLSPWNLRQLHSQLDEIIVRQDYAQWVAAGNNPDGFTPHHMAIPQSDSDSREVARSRFDRLTDPAGVRHLLSGLEEESPIKGLSKGHLLFAVFMVIVLVLTVIQALA